MLSNGWEVMSSLVGDGTRFRPHCASTRGRVRYTVHLGLVVSEVASVEDGEGGTVWNTCTRPMVLVDRGEGPDFQQLV